MKPIMYSPEDNDDEDEASHPQDKQAGSSANGTDAEGNSRLTRDLSPEDELVLTVYDADVLKTWSKNELVADEQILDGMSLELLKLQDHSIET
jgi:hypothetical protein